jgi:AAA domain
MGWIRLVVEPAGSVGHRADSGKPETLRIELQHFVVAARAAAAEVIVLDPLYSTHDQDENDTRSMAALCQTLLRLRDATKTALIVVHHIRKSITREEIGSAFRGSSALHAVGDTYMLLTRPSPQLPTLAGSDWGRRVLVNTLGWCRGAGVGFALRDLPSGAANSRDWFRPEGFTAPPGANLAKSYPKKSTATGITVIPPPPPHSIPGSPRDCFRPEELNQTNENSGRGK